MAISSSTAGLTRLRIPLTLESTIAMIPGIVESGLFTGFTDKTTVIVGDEKKCRVITSPDASIFP